MAEPLNESHMPMIRRISHELRALQCREAPHLKTPNNPAIDREGILKWVHQTRRLLGEIDPCPHWQKHQKQAINTFTASLPESRLKQFSEDFEAGRRPQSRAFIKSTVRSLCDIYGMKRQPLLFRAPRGTKPTINGQQGLFRRRSAVGVYCKKDNTPEDLLSVALHEVAHAGQRHLRRTAHLSKRFPAASEYLGLGFVLNRSVLLHRLGYYSDHLYFVSPIEKDARAVAAHGMELLFGSITVEIFDLPDIASMLQRIPEEETRTYAPGELVVRDLVVPMM